MLKSNSCSAEMGVEASIVNVQLRGTRGYAGSPTNTPGTQTPDRVWEQLAGDNSPLSARLFKPELAKTRVSCSRPGQPAQIKKAVMVENTCPFCCDSRSAGASQECVCHQ